MKKHSNTKTGLANLTQAEINKSSYLARRIQKDMRCSNDEATKAALGYVKQFGSK